MFFFVFFLTGGCFSLIKEELVFCCISVEGAQNEILFMKH